MKNKITFPGSFLLVWAIPFFCSGQTGEPEKMSEKEKEARMEVLASMASRNQVLNALVKKIAFSKDKKNSIYEVKDLPYKYVLFADDKIIPLPYDEIIPLLPFRVYVKYKIKEKWGAFDVGGKELLKPEYDEIKYDAKKPNYFYVRKDEDDYYINPFSRDRSPFLILNEKNEYYPKIAFKNEHYGLVNKEGKLIAPLKYDEISSFNSTAGLAVIKRDKKYGFIDQSGKEVIPLKYDGAENFSEGLALVRINGKYGYIDPSGKEAIPVKYDRAWSYSSEGPALVKVNGKYGYIDAGGKVVIPIKYDYASSDFPEGLAYVRLNGKYGFIDRAGKEVVALKYDYADRFSEGRAKVGLDKRYGFIDKSGREVISVKYDDAGYFFGGETEVKLGDRYFHIDKDGNELKSE